MNYHLPNPWLSSPLCVFLEIMGLLVIIVVPTGLYIGYHGRLVSAVVTDASFHSFAIILQNLSFACLFFQCVLVSASIRMLYCWDLLLLQSSFREWVYVPKARPLVLFNSILVAFGFFVLGTSLNDKFLSSSIIFIRLVWTIFFFIVWVRVLSWFTFVLFNNDFFRIALDFFGANILYGSFLGSSIFRHVNSLIL